MSSLVQAVAVIVMFLLVVLLFALISALPIWLLWNWLVPAIFHGPSITLLQALGIAILSSLLFKSSSSSSSN